VCVTDAGSPIVCFPLRGRRLSREHDLG